MSSIEIHLFGARTSVGHSLVDLCFSSDDHWEIFAYSREKTAYGSKSFFVDLDEPATFFPAGSAGKPAVWIVFAPIWKFASFFAQLSSRYPDRISGASCLIACSSSSSITKRFAFNGYDRELFSRLNSAEQNMLEVCRQFELPCRILQPTLIYGRSGVYRDRNLSRLLQLMRLLPVLPMPSQSGLRQPIHATQLASVTLHLVRQFFVSGWNPSLQDRISLGGDTTLSYGEMISALQHSQPFSDASRRCRLLPIPNRLFFFADRAFALTVSQSL